MARLIAGIKMKDLAEQFGISRQTLHRYAKESDWPGDHASYAAIHAHIASKTGNSGRPSAASSAGASVPVRAAAAGDDDDMLDQISQINSLSEEAKMVLIEVNKTKCREGQKKIIERYGDEVRACVSSALDHIFQVISGCELTAGQINNIREAIETCKKEMKGLARDQQLELNL